MDRVAVQTANLKAAVHLIDSFAEQAALVECSVFPSLDSAVEALDHFPFHQVGLEGPSVELLLVHLRGLRLGTVDALHTAFFGPGLAGLVEH